MACGEEGTWTILSDAKFSYIASSLPVFHVEEITVSFLL